MRAYGHVLINATAPVFGALVALWIIWNVETRFFPVITEWKLERVERSGDQYTLDGRMTKKRSCELIATNVMAAPKISLAPRILLYRITPNDIDGGNAPVGHSRWGPWTMNVPKAFTQRRGEIAFIQVIGVHRCHAFWNQETLYGVIHMEQLP